MRSTRRVVGMASIVVIAATTAFAQQVASNYVPGTDFSKYKTYKWVAIPGAEVPDQIVDAEIRQAIDTNLAGKGFTKVTGDAADMFIGYQVAVQQERQWNAYGGMGWRFGGMGTATSSTLNVGTLILDIYDAKAQQLIWKGESTKTIDPSKNPQKNQENIQKAMNKLLKDFPPQK